MTRDEMASEYSIKDCFLEGVEAMCPIAMGHFKAGWDAALLHDERVLELVKLLDFYSKGGNPHLDTWHDEVLGYFTGKHAREALKKWRGEE